MIKTVYFIAILFISTLTFGQVNLNAGLVAYYPFNGNANDESGNGNNPIFNNAILTNDEQGNPNSAYNFNGIDQYIQIPNSPSLNMSNQISISLKVRPLGFYTGPCYNNMMVMKGDADYLDGNYSLRFADVITGCTTPTTTNEQFLGGDAVAATNPIVQLNKWYTVVWTYDGTIERIYVDCVLQDSLVISVNSFTNQYDLFIGKLNNSQYPYWLNGDLDEVRIYNRAINDQEVKALCTTTSDTTVINDYTPVINFDICKNQITVADATKYNVGDTVLLIQMKGAVIDSTNTSSFGTVTNYKNAGNYEYNYVKSKTGNIIDLKNTVTRQYDIGNGKVQLIRVPYFSNYNVTNTLSCLPWNGTIGGVLALNVKDSLILNADIDVSGKGFMGGDGTHGNPPDYNCNENQFYYPPNTIFAAGKGEGIAIISSNKIDGKGRLANGGGGGNSHNSGGGGGSNASPEVSEVTSLRAIPVLETLQRIIEE